MVTIKIHYCRVYRINYIDRPLQSGNFLNESAFCALLDENIYPKVRKRLNDGNFTPEKKAYLQAMQVQLSCLTMELLIKLKSFTLENTMLVSYTSGTHKIHHPNVL